jgi:hypothetical protein
MATKSSKDPKSVKEVKGMEEPVQGAQMPAGEIEEEAVAGEISAGGMGSTADNMPAPGMGETASAGGKMPAGSMGEPAAAATDMPTPATCEKNDRSISSARSSRASTCRARSGPSLAASAATARSSASTSRASQGGSRPKRCATTVSSGPATPVIASTGRLAFPAYTAHLFIARLSTKPVCGPREVQ